MSAPRTRTDTDQGPILQLTLHVDQTSADVWHLPGEVSLSGYVDNVSDPETAQVKVQVRGHESVTATLSPLDRDKAGATRLRWSVRLRLDAPVTGSATATVLAGVGRQSVAVRRTFTVALGRDGPSGELLSPPAVADASGDVLTVNGWCLFPLSRTARVAVFVDGDMVGLARTYTECAAEVPHHSDSALCGFESVLNVRRSERSDMTEVFVEATSLDGRRWRSAVHFVTWSERSRDWEVSAQLQNLVVRNTEVVRSVATDRSAVVVFAHDLGFAGAQLWLADLLRTIVSRGRSRCLVVALRDGPMRPVLESMGLEVHITSSPLLGSAPSFDGWVHEMALLVRAHGAGAVLANTLLLFPAVLAAESANVPCLWALHESIEPASFFEHYGRTGLYGDRASDFDPIVRDRFETSFERPSALVFEAAQTEAFYRDIKGATPTLVVGYEVDPGPIDSYRATADRDALRAGGGFTRSDVVLLVVGVFDPRKSIGMVVAAFDELSLVHEHLHLVLVGSWASGYAEAVEEMARQSHHPDRIRIEPVTDDIYRFYAIADFLVSASDTESVPRSFMEAMAFELPIVAADAFGVGELLQDSVTGWLTRPRDLEGLVGLLHSVLTKPPGEVTAVAEAARMAALTRGDGPGYGEFYAEALEALSDCPDADLFDVWKLWNERKGAA
jgi:glycosyltransferase involved in cell wall biosynthesis